MPHIVVLGKPEFLIGFELAGIKDTIPVDNNSLEASVSKALADDCIGILVMHKSDVDRLPVRLQEKFDSSVRPTTVVVSEKQESDNRLRNQIQKAIGVDVWAKDD